MSKMKEQVEFYIQIKPLEDYIMKHFIFDKSFEDDYFDMENVKRAYAFDYACILYNAGLTVEKLKTEYKDLPIEWLLEIYK